MALRYTILTPQNRKALQSGQKLFEHGIYFERLSNGDGRWSVSFMVDRQRVHRVVGLESDGTTRTQAEAYIEQIRTDARNDRLNLPKGRKVSLNFTVASAEYLLKMEASGGKDLTRKRSIIKHHLDPFFGSIPLNKITAFDISRYKKQRLASTSLLGGDSKTRNGAIEKPVAPATVQRELAILSHIFNMAAEWGWITSKPVIEGIKLDDARLVYLTEGQIETLLRCAKDDVSWEIYPFLRIGLATSMRKMEILSIKIANIDLDRQVIHVPIAKSGSREQPITPSLANYLSKLLEQIPEGQVYLFPTPVKTAKFPHLTNIQKPFRRVVAAAGLDPKQVVRHTLRHTAITHLVQVGVDLPTVKRISGHKSLKMVERYAHQSGQHIAAAMNKLDARYQKKEG